MHQPSTLQNFPFALGDIMQLASDASEACARSTQHTTKVHASDVIRDAFNVSEACIVAQETNSTDLAERIARIAKYVEPPASSDWVAIRHDLFGLSPTFLRKTYQAVAHGKAVCDRGTLFLQALMLRHIVGCLAAQQPVPESHLGNRQTAARSLVRTARLQKSMFSGNSNDFSCATLAVKYYDDCMYSDNYLITVNNVCDEQQRGKPNNIVSRVKTALLSVDNTNVNHSVIMVDDINRCDITKHINYGRNIHLIGNKSDVRFVIVVSGIVNQDKHDRLHKETYGGRVRLDKSLLRDVFSGYCSDRTNHVTNKIGVTNWMQSATASNSPAPHTRTDVRGVPFARLQEVQSERITDLLTDQLFEDDTDDETVISSNKVAREFFGYKGLPDLGLK